MKNYFYLQKGKVVGPISFEDICREIEFGRLNGFDLIYRDDEKKWKPLGDFKELESALTQKSKGEGGEELESSESEETTPGPVEPAKEEPLEAESESKPMAFQDEVANLFKSKKPPESQQDEEDELELELELNEEGPPEHTKDFDIKINIDEEEPGVIPSLQEPTTEPFEEKTEKAWVILKARLKDGDEQNVELKQTGPFSTSLVKKMLTVGELEYQDFAWHEKMSEWKKIVDLEELHASELLPASDSDDLSGFSIEEFVNTLKAPDLSGDELLNSVKIVPKRPEQTEEVPQEAIPIEKQEEKVAQVIKIRAVEKRKSKEKKKVKPAPVPKKKAKAKPVVRKESQTNTSSLDFEAYEKEHFKFRLRQGIFISFVLGSVLWFAVMVSHENLIIDLKVWTKQQWQGLVSEFTEDSPPKKNKAKPKPKPRMKSTQSRPPIEEKAPGAKSKGVAKKKIQKPPKIATYVKISLKNLAGKSPRVQITTDATHHYPTSWVITGAAGQILNRPSYHREWSQKLKPGQSRDLNLTKYYLGAGWYTVQAQIGAKKALKTFFYGSKKGFKKKVRDYRKVLGVLHQNEKEELYFLGKKLIEAAATAQSLVRTSQLAPRQRSRTVTLALKSLSSIKSQYRRKLKSKNKNLWTVHWMELKDLESEAKDIIQAADKQPKASRVQRQVKNFSKSAKKWVAKINGLSVAR